MALKAKEDTILSQNLSYQYEKGVVTFCTEAFRKFRSYLYSHRLL